MADQLDKESVSAPEKIVLTVWQCGHVEVDDGQPHDCPRENGTCEGEEFAYKLDGAIE